jgi:hypothetical protein
VTGGPAQGWPFLVARGREIGYQLLLAPDFILAGRESGLVLGEVRGEVPADGPARVTVVGSGSGPLSVVQRTVRATRGDVGATDRPEAPLLDRAGRPILLGYGFVCRGTGLDGVDERDLEPARSAALAAYRRFYAAEEDFVPEPSQPYRLSSTLVAATAVPTPGPRRRSAPVEAPASVEASGSAWTSEVLPSAPVAPPARPPARSVLAVAAAVVLVVLALGIYLVNSNGPARPPDVAVPKLVGLTQGDAEQRLRKANLVPKVVDGRPDRRPAGTVIDTRPPAGQLVPPGSQIGLVLSIGPPLKE